MKKKVTIALASLMMLTLTACGDKDKETTTAATTEATTAASVEETTAAAEETTEAVTEAATTASEEETTEKKAEGTDSTSGTTGDDFYKVCTNADKKTVEDFAAKARDAYVNGDWETLSGMILYPIKLAEGVTAEDNYAFMDYMNSKKVTDADKKEMEAETCQDMFARDQGICLGSGQIWIGENVDDSKLYVISISGLE
ncbi:MAG: hypothetical protein J5929_04985 [Eubacterium sp.]|nr:hypothetical protein [Eubacterium sp.]